MNGIKKEIEKTRDIKDLVVLDQPLWIEINILVKFADILIK